MCYVNNNEKLTKEQKQNQKRFVEKIEKNLNSIAENVLAINDKDNYKKELIKIIKHDISLSGSDLNKKNFLTYC